MNRVLLRAGIVVVCLPMLFTAWLMTSVYWPRMDALTLKLPMPLRSLVAEVIAQSPRHNADRATRLDPQVQFPIVEQIDDSAVAADVPDDFHPGYTANSPEAAKLDTQGVTKEANGDECGAVTFYTLADSKEDPSNGVYRYAEHKGRAALVCGKSLGAAQVGFETALRKEKTLLQSSVGDQRPLQATMQQDREWLIVVYDRVNEPGMAHDLCKVTHPQWKSCSCKLAGKEVKCSNAPA